MNELALFAGAGGGILGTRLLGWRTICAVEFNPYRQAVLLARQADGVLDPFPLWSNVETFDGAAWRGRVDVLTAGFPCQPFSLAGRKRGAKDPRNRWPDTLRVLLECGAPYAFLENVPGLLGRHGYFGTILRDLAEGGYDAVWDCFSAGARGAAHCRERLWILAHRRGWIDRAAHVADADDDAARLTLREREREPAGGGDAGRTWRAGAGAVAGRHSSRTALGRQRCGWIEPGVGRTAHGVAARLDRLEALGDGQVPAVVAHAWRELSARLYAMLPPERGAVLKPAA